MLSEKEKEVLFYISENGLRVSKSPFSDVAAALGLGENEVIRIITTLQEKGIVKSLRGVINHVKAGYTTNALIAWCVKPQAVDKIKDVLVGNNMVSHCYERQPHKDFNYNIFTMMHACRRQQIESFVREVSEAYDVGYEILFTEKELKKQKMNLRELLCR